MKKIIFLLFMVYSIKSFSQIVPNATYEGDLYFIPAKLTSKGEAFIYSHHYESRKNMFTIFDSELNVQKQVEIEPQILNYSERTVTYQRKYFKGGSNTRATSSVENNYFLDNWTITSDVTEETSQQNSAILDPEIYEDNNNYHSNSLYLSQTLFNDDDDFEFLRYSYKVMPLDYCASDDNTSGSISVSKATFGGEECDYYTQEYNSELNGYVYTLFRYKTYGGIKKIGIDVVSIDGAVKKTLEGITSLNSVYAINGYYYVDAYDSNSGKNCLYKLAKASTPKSSQNSSDVNSDGKVDSQDVLKVYDYMKSH